MLTRVQLRKAAHLSGARSADHAETDVILTYILQCFEKHKLTDHLAFKGGTMLRKMIFGSQGRLSTDLDFTLCSDETPEDVEHMLLAALYNEFEGVVFSYDRNKDIYTTDDSVGITPICSHEANTNGKKIKIQVSLREKPILPIELKPQLKLPFFDFLPFAPVQIPCVAYPEIVSEKIRAAYQRIKIRDLYDLDRIASRADIDQNVVRSLAVLKLWNSGDEGFSYQRFVSHVKTGAYDINDLDTLLRKDQRANVTAMVNKVIRDYRFLEALTGNEACLAEDTKGTRIDTKATLIDEVRSKHRT